MHSLRCSAIAWAMGGACVLAILSGCGTGTPPTAGASGRGQASAIAVGSQGQATFTLPLVSDAAKSLASGLQLDVSIAGGADKTVEVDTGSRGLVIARTAIGPQATDTGQKGQIEYTSDGLILSGEYFLAPITFHTSSSTAATVPVRILGVESSSCDSKYPHCTPTADISHVGVLGVGYNDHADQPATETNPFLQLQAMNSGAARHGYIITRNGITLGVTASTTPSSFNLVALPKATGQAANAAGLPGSWGPAPGCFTLPDFGSDTHCGTILVDTGIGTMIVGLDASQRPPTLQGTLPNGTRIQIGVPAFTNPALSYTVTTGAAADPLAPQGNPAARWSASGPFVNTGRHLLAGYDYLFDADTGQIGFRADLG